MTLKLNNYYCSFLAGEKITGSFLFFDDSVKTLRIYFVGEVVSHSPDDDLQVHKDFFELRQTMKLTSENDRRKGTFDIQLPNQMIPSLELSNVSVRYTLKIIGSSNSDEILLLCSKHPTINNTFDSSKLTESIYLQKNFPQNLNPLGSCLSCSSINVSLKLLKSGYVCGENILFDARIDNDTNTHVIYSKISLIQIVKIKTLPKKKNKQIIASLERGYIAPRANQTWIGEIITVPPLPCTTKTHTCSVKYALEMVIAFDKKPNDLRVFKTAIFIGTNPSDKNKFESIYKPFESNFLDTTNFILFYKCYQMKSSIESDSFRNSHNSLVECYEDDVANDNDGIIRNRNKEVSFKSSEENNVTNEIVDNDLNGDKLNEIQTNEDKKISPLQRIRVKSEVTPLKSNSQISLKESVKLCHQSEENLSASTEV